MNIFGDLGCIHIVKEGVELNLTKINLDKLNFNLY